MGKKSETKTESTKTVKAKVPLTFACVFYKGIISTGRCIVEFTNDAPEVLYASLKKYYGEEEDGFRGKYIKCTKSIDEVKTEVHKRLKDKKITDIVFKETSKEIVKILKDVCEKKQCTTMGVYTTDNSSNKNDESDDDEEEAPKKNKSTKKSAKTDKSDDDKEAKKPAKKSAKTDDSEDEAPKKKPTKKATKTPEPESDASDSEEEAPKKPAKKATKATEPKKASQPVVTSDDEDEIKAKTSKSKSKKEEPKKKVEKDNKKFIELSDDDSSDEEDN
jgi:hypothetical protein